MEIRPHYLSFLLCPDSLFSPVHGHLHYYNDENNFIVFPVRRIDPLGESIIEVSTFYSLIELRTFLEIYKEIIPSEVVSRIYKEAEDAGLPAESGYSLFLN